MALTTFIVYVTASGVVKGALYADDADAPTPGAGESVLDAGLLDPLPDRKAYRVVGGVLTARAQNDIDAEETSERREAMRRQIATLEAMRDKYQTEGPPWDTTALDDEIALVRAEHDALP